MTKKALLAFTMALIMTLGYFLPAQPPFNLPAVRAQHRTYVYYASPRAQKYYFTTFNDPASEFSAFQGGSIDVTTVQLTQGQLTTTQGNNKYQVNLSNDLGSAQVIFDNGRFPSNDTAFRQALSLMIDRGDIVTTSLQGVGNKMPDQLTPTWPSAYHVSGGFNWDINLAQANATLFAGGFRYNSGGSYWYNIANVSNHVSPATTIFYSRSDDPNRLYIGIQVATMQGATKATYHFDKLFTVEPVTGFVTTLTAYNAPVSSGGGYKSNNCNGSGFPCFTAYTQEVSFAIPDPSWFYFSFGPGFLDVPFQNFGHWNNATIMADVSTLYFAPTIVNSQVRLVNKEITQQAYWDPIYYLQDWSAASERVTGHLSGQNSGVPGGSFAFSNQESYWRLHLKGRLYGGSIRIGVSNPITELNIFNPNSNWIYNAEILNRIYDSLLNFDYDTAGFFAGLATEASTTLFTGPVYNSKFQSGSPGWITSTSAPYWTKGANGYHTVSGERLDFTLLTNATWHDGSPVTANDVIWNAITAAMDSRNLQNTAWVSLDDINATGNVVHMFFNSTGFDELLLAALAPIAPPSPWILNRDWGAHKGVVSDISLASKGSLNLTAGALNLLDGSGSYKLDTATTGDPFTVGSTFDLVANNNWYFRDPNKATYATGIADLTAYSGSVIVPGTPINVKVALTNGNNTKGDVFSGGNFVADPSTTSDTTSGATVTAIVYESPSDTVTLSYNSGTGLYTGLLPTTGLFSGHTYHVQITATKAGSIPTMYGPEGSSQASAVGVSWEGDPVNTVFTTACACISPVSPFQLFAGLLTVMAFIAVSRRVRQIRF